jgi:hypothetical protein
MFSQGRRCRSLRIIGIVHSLVVCLLCLIFPGNWFTCKCGALQQDPQCIAHHLWLQMQMMDTWSVPDCRSKFSLRSWNQASNTHLAMSKWCEEVYILQLRDNVRVSTFKCVWKGTPLVCCRGGEEMNVRRWREKTAERRHGLGHQQTISVKTHFLLRTFELSSFSFCSIRASDPTYCQVKCYSYHSYFSLNSPAYSGLRYRLSSWKIICHLHISLIGALWGGVLNPGSCLYLGKCSTLTYTHSWTTASSPSHRERFYF